MFDRYPRVWNLGVVFAIATGLMLVAVDALATDWPMFRLDPAHKGTVEENGPSEFHVLWEYPTTAEVNGQAAVVEDRVYFVDQGGKLYCLNASDGSLVWEKTGHGGFNTACPAVVDGRVYIGKGPNSAGFVCRSAGDGALLWTQDSFGKVRGSPVVADGKVFYATLDNYVVCMSASATKNLIWYYDAGEEMWGSPAVNLDTRRIYVGTTSSHLMCLPMDEPAPADGVLHNEDLKWIYSANGAIYGSPAVYLGDNPDEVFFGTAAGDIYALKDDGGGTTVKWQYDTGSQSIVGSPAVNASCVWLGSDDGKLYCINRPDGTLRWSYQTASTDIDASPAVADEYVYVTVGTNDFALYCLDAYNAPAELKWKDRSYHYQYSSPAVSDEVLYVGVAGSGAGKFVAVRNTSEYAGTASCYHPGLPGALSFAVRWDGVLAQYAPSTGTFQALGTLGASSLVPDITAYFDAGRQLAAVQAITSDGRLYEYDITDGFRSIGSYDTVSIGTHGFVGTACYYRPNPAGAVSYAVTRDGDLLQYSASTQTFAMLGNFGASAPVTDITAYYNAVAARAVVQAITADGLLYQYDSTGGFTPAPIGSYVSGPATQGFVGTTCYYSATPADSASYAVTGSGDLVRYSAFPLTFAHLGNFGASAPVTDITACYIPAPPHVVVQAVTANGLLYQYDGSTGAFAPVGSYAAGTPEQSALQPVRERCLFVPNPGPQGALRVPVERSATAAEIRIYDAAGRGVRCLQVGAVAPPEACVWWDGRDEQGAVVAPGTYFFQVTGSAGGRGKAVVIR
jgi:outer membrane protein assembly factor BamB